MQGTWETRLCLWAVAQVSQDDSLTENVYHPIASHDITQDTVLHVGLNITDHIKLGCVAWTAEGDVNATEARGHGATRIIYL